jgi:ribosomal protein S18 acetylase RimI-like enzyme
MPVLEVRAATPDDYELYTRAFAELKVPDPPRARERWIRANLPTTLFFEEQGRFVAYAFFQLLEDTGYVRNMVVEPSARGRGVGRAVMLELRKRFVAAGCVRWCLNVKPDNLAAIRVYEQSGLRAVFQSRTFLVDSEVVARLPAAATSWHVELLTPDEDEAVESAFGIERGLIAVRRKSPEVHVLALWNDDGVAGVACYDVERFANPFAVESVGAGRALLEALLPMAAGGSIHVVANANPELDGALAEAGAEVELEFVHYRASLV